MTAMTKRALDAAKTFEGVFSIRALKALRLITRNGRKRNLRMVKSREISQ